MKEILIFLVVVALWVSDRCRYQATEPYRCDGRKEVLIARQTLIPQDSLELYVGGWIEEGDVEISGLPSRDNATVKFSRGASVSTVSHAYIGEWDETTIRLVFEPTEGASCFIRVVYR